MALPEPDPHSTCLVTGASSGIGADVARSLARRGHGLTLAARREERLGELAAELRDAHGVRVDTIECDLSDEADRARMLERLAELAVNVEVLVNNAGFGTGGRFERLHPERELEMVRVNVEAPVALCARFVPDMVRRGRGAILNVASTAAFQPLPRQATYAATKAFVLSFTEGLHAGDDAAGLPSVFWADAPEVAEEGVRGLEHGKRVVVPGLLNRGGAIAGHHTPRSLLLRVVERITPLGR